MPTPTTIIVSPSAVTLPAGSQQQFVATVLDENGLPVLGAVVTWGDPDVGAITQAGLYSTEFGITSGTIPVGATLGAAQGTATVTLVAGPVASLTVPQLSELIMSLAQTPQFGQAVRDANALNVSPGVQQSAGGVATAAEVAAAGAGGAAGPGAAAGTGALPVAVAVTDGSGPVQAASVRATMNGQTAAVATTDATGSAALALNAGTYTVTATAAGLAGATVTATVAPGQQAVAVAMVPTAIAPPASAGQVVGTVTKTTGAGRPLAGAVFTFQLVGTPAGADVSGSTTPYPCPQTDADGHACLEFSPGWAYRGWPGTVTTPALAGPGVRFVAPAVDFNVPSILGP